MAFHSLKQAFHEDVHTLKRLELEIMPAKSYYSKLFLGWLIVYILFVGAQSLGCLFALEAGAWGYVSEREQERADSQKEFKIKFFSFHKTWEEQQQEKQKIELAYQDEIEHYHVVRVFKMVTGVLFSSLLFTFFLLGKVKNYVLFKHQLSPYLQTGAYLAKKMKQAFLGYFALFACFSLGLFPLFEADMTVFAGIGVFIFSAIVISIAINMEVSRIGISVLSGAIANYFGHGKTVDTVQR